MTKPTILDAAGNRLEGFAVVDERGRQLHVGSPVRDSLNDSFEGEVQGFRVLKSGLRVDVLWHSPPSAQGCVSARKAGKHPPYRCPDLTLITTTEEERP